MCHMFEQKRNKIIRSCDISVDEVCGTSPDITRNRERERKDGADKLNLSGSGSGCRAEREWRVVLVSVLRATGGLTPTRARNIRAQGSLASAAQATKTKRCCAFIFVSFGGVCIDKGRPLHLHTMSRLDSALILFQTTL